MVKQRKSSRKSKLDRRKKEPLGVNVDLPEGVFGIIDDLTPLLRPEKLYEVEPDRSPLINSAKLGDVPWHAKPKKSKRTKPRVAEMSLPNLQINQEAYEDKIPDLEYVNTIKIPESLLRDVRRKTDQRTRDLSLLIMSRMIPTFLGLDAAQNYVTTAMRDGLGVEIELEDSVLEAAKAMVNLDLSYYFLRRSTLPKKFKHQFLSTLVEESAKQTLTAMNTNKSKSGANKHLQELQSIISRGVSSMQRREDRERRKVSADENEPMFREVDIAQERRHTSQLGLVKRSPPKKMKS